MIKIIRITILISSFHALGSEAYGIVSNILTYVATSKPTLCIGEVLCWIHDTTGFHWYTTIICSTIVFRFMFMGQAHITSKKVIFSLIQVVSAVYS